MNNEFFDNLKREAEHNPTVAIAVVAGLLTAGAKFIEAVAYHKRANIFAKDAKRGTKNAKKQ